METEINRTPEAETQNVNIKTVKYKMLPSETQVEILDRWMGLCKEAYNLMLEQRLATKTYNDAQYYAFYPDKLAAKEKRESEYQEKVAQEVASGRRLSKKERPKAIPRIKRDHPELQQTNLDVLTYVSGHNGVEQVEKFKNPNQAPDKPLKLRISWQSQSTFLTLLKDTYPEFKDVPSDLLAYVSKTVDQAWQKYEKNLREYKPGQRFPLPPKFVSFRDDYSMTYMRGNGFKVKQLEGNKKVRILGIPKVKEGFKVIYHKKITGKVVQQAIIQEAGQFYLCVTFHKQKVHWPAKQKQVGVDLGITRNIQLSDGSFKQLPLEQIKLLEKKKAQMQVRFRRMKLGGKNYYKLQERVAKIDKKIARIRKYHIAMFATEIVRDNELIGVEFLRVKNMTKSAKGDLETPGKKVAQKSGLNRSMLRVAPYAIKLAMQNKAKEYDRVLIEVDPKYTSQICSGCGHKDKENRESQEVFVCKNCGLDMNADHNAAVNVLNRALKDC